MKIASITKGRLVSDPGHNNRKAEVTVQLDAEDTIQDANEYADRVLEKLLADPTRDTKIADKLNYIAGELNVIEDRLHPTINHVIIGKIRDTAQEVRNLKARFEDDDIPF